MPIQTLLWDADGVLQYPTVRWRQGLAALLAPDYEAQIDPLLQDILQAERDLLATPTGFVERMEESLTRLNLPVAVADLLNVITAIGIYTDVMEIVQAVRRAGIACHIASNQQHCRAQYMSTVLNYQTLFDQEWYSCFLGAAKPDVVFFERAVAALGCDANTVLFLDDRADNVAGAQQASLHAEVYHATQGPEVLRQMLLGYGVPVTS